MHLNRDSRLPAVSLVLVTALALGCEETGSSTAAPPQAQPAGAQSAYGKAQERADRLKGQIDDYQQEVIRQQAEMKKEGKTKKEEEVKKEEETKNNKG